MAGDDENVGIPGVGPDDLRRAHSVRTGRLQRAITGPSALRKKQGAEHAAPVHRAAGARELRGAPTKVCQSAPLAYGVRHKNVCPRRREFGCLIGASGTGKSNALMDYIEKSSGEYQKIIICSFSTTDEPLYQYLKK